MATTKSNTIIVYSKNHCMQCKMIKKFLTEHNVPFVEHNVDEEPHYITHIKDELGFMAVPVIECDGVAFQGFNPTELRKLESVSV